MTFARDSERNEALGAVGIDQGQRFPEVSFNNARDEADKIRRAARDGLDLRKQRLHEEARASLFGKPSTPTSL